MVCDKLVTADGNIFGLLDSVLMARLKFFRGIFQENTRISTAFANNYSVAAEIMRKFFFPFLELVRL